MQLFQITLYKQTNKKVFWAAFYGIEPKENTHPYQHTPNYLPNSHILFFALTHSAGKPSREAQVDMVGQALSNVTVQIFSFVRVNIPSK